MDNLGEIIILLHGIITYFKYWCVHTNYYSKGEDGAEGNRRKSFSLFAHLVQWRLESR